MLHRETPDMPLKIAVGAVLSSRVGVAVRTSPPAVSDVAPEWQSFAGRLIYGSMM